MSFLYLTQLLFLPKEERKAWNFKQEEIVPDFVKKMLLLSEQFQAVYFFLESVKFGRIFWT